MESPIKMKAALEAIIFYAIDPMEPEELAQALNTDEDTVRLLLEELANEYKYDDNRGIQIEYIAGGVIVSPKDIYVDIIKDLYQPKVQQRITQASLETLAIIAYRQPITRGDIEEIRGVKAEKALFTLVRKGLIEEVGRVEKTGTPILYGTTDLFLKSFRLNSIADLPDPEKIKGSGGPLLHKEDADLEILNSEDPA